MKKIYLTAIGILVLLVSTVTPINAQSTEQLINAPTSQTPEIQDVDGLRAEFKEYMQDPETKNTRFEMILKSNIDSDRVKVTWTIKGDVALFIDESLKEKDIAIRKGETYTIPIIINTTGVGITELKGKAEAFGTSSTYLVTITKNIITNLEGEIASSYTVEGTNVIFNLPGDYQTAKTLMILKNAAIILGAVILILVLGFFGIKKFTKWLNTEDPIKYDPEPLKR